MATIETQITIATPTAKIWAILTGFAAFPDWNPFVRSISGAPIPGTALTVQIAPPGQSGMTFTPTVLVATPERELRWRGTFLGRAMFAGEHSFVLERLSAGSTRFLHAERFSGLMAPLIMSGKTLAATKQGFEAMNEALKRRAESST